MNQIRSKLLILFPELLHVNGFDHSSPEPSGFVFERNLINFDHSVTQTSRESNANALVVSVSEGSFDSFEQVLNLVDLGRIRRIQKEIHLELSGKLLHQLGLVDRCVVNQHDLVIAESVPADLYSLVQEGCSGHRGH